MKWLLCGFGPMVALAMAGPAAAADASVPLKGPIADADNAPAPRVAGFSGVDITSQGRYSAFLGGTIAASGDLDTSGFRVGIVGASGTYKFHSETFDTLNRAIFTTA